MGPKKISDPEPTWVKSLLTEFSTVSTNVENLEAKITAMDIKVTAMDSKITNMDTLIKSIGETADFAVKQAEDSKKTAQNAEKLVKEVREENNKLYQTLNALTTKINNLELQTRRENLIFCGIKEKKEETWEDCEKAIREILTKIDLPNVKFERTHRLGNKRAHISRNIIAKFSFYKDRHDVWQNRHKLAGSSCYILEDYPQEINKKRKLLYPAFKAAQRQTEFHDVKLKVDKLMINGKTFTVDNMNQLPKCLQPENAAVTETEDVVVFFTKNAIFSNLHPIDIQIEGHTYNCNEQYYQSSKALFFNDEDAAAEIKKETDPYNMIQISKTIKGYKHTVWENQSRKVLIRANEAKYRQSEKASQKLQATGTRRLGEASADKTFGTGVGLFSKKATDQGAWVGTNMMGSILEEIRDKLFPLEHSDSEESSNE